MKKLDPPSSYNVSIRGVHLTRDDVEVVLELFRRDLGPPKITDDHFEYASLDEFIKSKGERPSFLKVEAQHKDEQTFAQQSISATFEGNRVWIWSSSERPFHEVRDFLTSKCSRLFSTFGPDTWAYVSILSLGIFLSYVQMQSQRHEKIPIWPLYILAGSVLVLIFSLVFRRYYFGVWLSRRHVGGFFKRHSGKIIYLIAGAAISGAVQLVVKFISKSN